MLCYIVETDQSLVYWMFEIEIKSEVKNIPLAEEKRGGGRIFLENAKKKMLGWESH